MKDRRSSRKIRSNREGMYDVGPITFESSFVAFGELV